MGDDTVAGVADTQADSLSAPASPIGEVARGTAIGRYLVLGVLGAGGMGVVYAAYDPELDRKVAIKLVRRATGASDDSGGRARMLREAQGIAKLSHPNVVAVHDVGTHGDEVFVAMELVDGDNLTRWLKAATRDARDIIAVMAQAGRGLAAAHRAGLVHRDFKPDNVLVGRDGRARVVDFGLVRQADREDAPKASSSNNLLATELTQAGALMGTPAYMAPEQFSDGIADARSDQYAFCVSIFEALYGRRPYDGKDLAELSGRVLSGQFVSLPAPRKVPPHVRAAIRRGLSTDASGRFATMDDLLAELARDPAAQRRRWFVAGGAVVAVAAAAIVPWLLLRGRGDDQVRCDDGHANLAGAWDADRRAALTKAFAATKIAFAMDAATAVSQQLDRYADRWASSYEASCKATYERREQSREVNDLHQICLASRRTELTSLVDLLMQVTPDSIATAPVAADALSPIDACEDAGQLLALAQTDDPKGRVAELTATLARARAHYDVGRYAEAIAAATPVAQEARERGYLVVLAEAETTIGQAHYSANEMSAAREPLFEGFVAGVESRDEATATAAATRLGAAIAADKDPARAREWLDIAAAYGRKWNNLAVQAQVASESADILMAEGKYAEAVTAYEHAKALAEQHPHALSGEESSAAPDIHRGLARAYDEVGRYKDARREGEEALAIFSKRLGGTHPAIAQILISLGNAADDDGDRASAAGAYDRALAILDATPGEHIDQRATLLTNLGVIANEEHRNDDARADLQRALALREAMDPEDLEVALVLNNLATVAHDGGHCDEAIADNTRALAIIEKRGGPTHPYIGDALVGLGQCQLDDKQVDAAIASFTRALAIRASGARPSELAEAQFGLAQALWAHGDRAKAIELAHAARTALAATPTDDKLVDIDKWLRDKS